MDTVRENIILEFIARAAVMRTTGPYATDIGATVLRARPNIDPGQLPCAIVWPQAETADNIHGKSRHRMTVRVEGIAAFGSTDPSIVSERILGDLIRCFASPEWDRRRPEPDRNPYADSIVYQGGGVEATPDEGARSVGAQATFMVVYDTVIGDPCHP